MWWLSSMFNIWPEWKCNGIFVSGSGYWEWIIIFHVPCGANTKLSWISVWLFAILQVHCLSHSYYLACVDFFFPTSDNTIHEETLRHAISKRREMRPNCCRSFSFLAMVTLRHNLHEVNIISMPLYDQVCAWHLCNTVLNAALQKKLCSDLMTSKSQLQRASKLKLQEKYFKVF